MPSPELLETFPNPYADRDYEIFMTCPEFTSLCPLGGIESDADELALLKGGAPDFATISITYIPGKVCVELKSPKFYLWSFRNDGIFYERVVNRILDDLVKAVTPKRMSVVGDFQRARRDQVGDYGELLGTEDRRPKTEIQNSRPEAGSPKPERALVHGRERSRLPPDRPAPPGRPARIRSHQPHFVCERGDFTHERVGRGIAGLVVELHKKPVAPRLTGRACLYAANVDAVM